MLRGRSQAATLSWPVRLVAVIPVVGALILSFSNLADLARSARFDGWLAFLWPGTLDATGVVASLVWLNATMPDDARRAARHLALAAIALSVAGNSLRHWLLDIGQRPHVVIQMAIAAVPPAVLFAMLHVLHLAQRRLATPASLATATVAQCDQAGRAAADQPAMATGWPGQVTLARVDDASAVAASQPPDTATPALVDQPHLAIPAASQPASPASPAGSTSWRDHIPAARQAIADQPDLGRARLAAKLGIPPSQARHLLNHMHQEETA